MEKVNKDLKPKIMLHIIMPNQVSGPNNAAKLISNSFLKEKYEFSFLTQTIHSGQKINFTLIRDLRQQIITFDPDVIHLTGLLGAGFHAVLAAWSCGKRNVLLTIRGSATDAINISNTARFVFKYIVEPLTMRLSRKVYAVCDAMANREYIRKHTKGRLVDTIHNSAPSIHKESILSFGLREMYGIAQEAVVITIVGRMVYDKGITYIIEAISRIQDKNIVFVFIGDGPYMEKLKITLSNEIVDKRVILLGKQNNVLSILNECDIFLFATLHENLSNALLEACSMGLAVIATNVGGNPEVIRNGYNGFLISPANTNEIEKTIIKLAMDDTLRKQIGINAIKTMEVDFSQTKLLMKLCHIYDELLSDKFN